MNWKRAGECALCGKSRCVVSSSNERMGYCFRFGKTYFVKPDSSVHYAGNTQSGNTPGSRRAKQAGQETFDFGNKSNNHLDAISS